MNSDMSLKLTWLTERFVAFVTLVKRKSMPERRFFVRFVRHHVLRQMPKPFECLATRLHKNDVHIIRTER